MRIQNAYWTDRTAENRQQQRWDAFCQSGSVADYLEYRACCTHEDNTYADASQSQGTRDTGDRLSGCR
ncbi:MAG: hypothetical protein IK134_13225 [Oscillospiraceae bacterium]|nr:hypothetical protein [Oscillospiraceae bacterium]MBQ5339990.1 hypothetical protein [Oscillospiraceae bacterium]MBQ9906085.1 hypothetical protein [Oscillospiraceae bacterium]MBR5364268.1 hypothetical protein [Oscillospiraceae bacterium]